MSFEIKNSDGSAVLNIPEALVKLVERRVAPRLIDLEGRIYEMQLDDFCTFAGYEQVVPVRFGY